MICTDAAGIGADAGRGRDFEILKGAIVLDFAMVAAGIGFFAVALLYTLACEGM